MKHIGTIIDKSYFDKYSILKGNSIHEYKICPYCMKEIELGYYENVLSAPYAIAPSHECRIWVNEARHRIGVIEKYYLPDEGFIFEPRQELK